jgi:magnesium transporter
MNRFHDNAVAALNKHYLDRFVPEAARILSRASGEEIGEVLLNLPIEKSILLWGRLHPDVVEKVMDWLPDKLLRELFMRSEPVPVSRMLTRMPRERQEYCMGLLTSEKRAEIRRLLEYPENSAGSLMDTRILGSGS